MPHQPLKRILYVEDDVHIRAVTEMALELIGGFTLQVCSSGEDAIHAAPGFAPDLLLLDVMMPGMDGPATLEALRALPQTASTPVVLMTANVQSGHVARYEAMGALGVVAKPFDPRQLVQQLMHFWVRSQDHE